MSIGFSTMNTGMARTNLDTSIINNLINLNASSLRQADIAAMLSAGKTLECCDPITATPSDPIDNTYEAVPVDPTAGAVTLTIADDSEFNTDKEFLFFNVKPLTTNIVVNTDGTAKFYGDGIADAGVITLTIAKKWGFIHCKKWADDSYFVIAMKLT